MGSREKKGARGALSEAVAVSAAAKVKDWFIIDDDFSVAGGEFTPTMKLKRSEIVKKHSVQINQIYSKQSL